MTKKTISTTEFIEKVVARATEVAQQEGLEGEELEKFMDFYDQSESDGYFITECGVAPDAEDNQWRRLSLHAKVVQEVDQDGGGEGGAEYCYTILKLGDDYWKFEYRYYSHHGYEYDDDYLTQVLPKDKLVTVYE